MTRSWEWSGDEEVNKGHARAEYLAMGAEKQAKLRYCHSSRVLAVHGTLYSIR